MKIDLTYTLTKEKISEWTTGLNDKDKGLMSFGHMGTHFDAMNKEFSIERYEYASDDYSKNFPQISWELIKLLVERQVKIIGVDTRGLRKCGEHPKADQFCADNGTFVIENLVNLGKICGAENLTIHTYPLNIRGFTGIPSRVVAEIQEAVE